jgi:hypothetical protein
MRKPLLWSHAALLALTLAYYVAAVTIYATPDANIGAALGVLVLRLMGSPWSWLLVDSTLPDTWLHFSQVAAMGVLNLALHWAAGTWWWRGSSHRM